MELRAVPNVPLALPYVLVDPPLLRSTLVYLLLLAALACPGCGGDGATGEGMVGDVTAGGDGSGSDAGRGGPEYIEPLIPPIVLDEAPIRSIDGGAHVDPLSLPVESITTGADFSADDRASFHAHGEEVCASGCAASRHPTPELTRTEFERLIIEYARGPLDETNTALESLMFYGRQTSAWLDELGERPLSEERARFLRSELRRTHALISFRIVDEYGVIRTHMPPTRVPLDRRHVFEMETEDLPPLETSGTVKRVGLHHLWTRL